MSPRVLAAIAVADFRERVRRPAYLVVLLGAVGLGYLAAPAAGDHWTIMNTGAYRGVYNSAYLGTVTALAGALWLTAGGFYVVRTAIARDAQTGVGQLLAATPVRTAGYLVGKYLSNLAVLASMAAVLAGTALVMQLARGESRAVDPVALLLPFVVFTLPVLALTAAAAVLFETIPGMRGGLGNVVWFFVAMIAMIAGQSAAAPLGGLGVPVLAASMRADLAARGLAVTEFSLGLMYLDEPPRTIDWPGADLTAGFAGGRLLLVVLAAAAAALPALWFARFDPARRLVAAGPAPAEPRPAYPAAVSLRTQPRRGGAFARLFAGELRILVGGVSRWWWLGVVALVVAGAAVPTRASGTVLLAAWIWPVLVWSRLGCQAREHGVEALLDAGPAPARRLLAQFLAGAALTALAGLGPGVRMALAGDPAGWLTGVLVIPALALALGVLSRGHRLFQVVYLPIWYAVLNDVAALDYLGVLPGGPEPALVATVAAALLGTALAVTLARHARR